MMKIYRTVDEQGFFREQTKLEKGCWINLINPTAQEINTLCNSIMVIGIIHHRFIFIMLIHLF